MVVTITKPSKSYHTVNFILPDVVVSENIHEVVSLSIWCHFKSYTTVGSRVGGESEGKRLYAWMSVRATFPLEFSTCLSLLQMPILQLGMS